ncbi:hypothetical protein [Shimia sp.]|uniref:hypothetical protein n=1 Tax=Shimia sp. TaxID=1954381 RepID=UPI00329723A6
MTESVQIKSRFPALYAQIADQRLQDPFLDEICCDLEALAAILEKEEATLEPQSLQNLRDSIRGLETEILATAKKPKTVEGG